MGKKLTLAEIILSLGLISSVASAKETQEMNRINEQVKQQATGMYVDGVAPLDTVFVYQNPSMKIHSCRRFTIFKTGSGAFIYDIGNDENGDRFIFVDGTVSRPEEGFIDLEGLGGVKGLDIKIDLNPMSKRVKGLTPYNTRKVYGVAYGDSSVTAGDFNKDAYGILEGQDGSETIRKLQHFYSDVRERAKALLGIKE